MSISQKSSQQTHEAVVFFADGEPIKEMLYTEFEALLDCVVPMRDFVAREMQAAYVRLDSGLAVVAVVLFLVRFDEAGFPEQSWNVPLRMLAESGARGPDLGGGPVRMATRSQCPVPGYEASLWDVQFGAYGNTLELLRERLHSNRLGIDAVDLKPLAASPAPSAWNQPPPPQHAGWPQQGSPQQQAWPQAHAAHAAAPVGGGEESAAALLAVMQQSNQQIAALRQQHQRELMDMQQRIAEEQQRCAELQQAAMALENEKRLLHGQVEEHMQAAEEERVRGERKVQLVIEKARAQTSAMRQELQDARDAAIAEGERRLAESVAERDRLLAERDRQLAEALAERDRAMAGELASRDRQTQEELARVERERQLHEEQMAAMRTELTELRRDKLRLMEGGADRFFAALQEKGVKFVSFQPGAGHLTIPMDDLYRFIEDTPRYVAEKCKVSEDHYLRWLAHYNNPVCQGSAGHGGPCGKPLTKMLKPAEFVAGLHDRCDIHKQVPRSQPREPSA